MGVNEGSLNVVMPQKQLMTTKLTNYIILLIIATIAASSCGQTKSQSETMTLTTQKTEVEVLSLLTISEKTDEFQLTLGQENDHIIWYVSY